MADEILRRDDNRVTVLGGITDDEAQEIRAFRVDPITGRLRLSVTGLDVSPTVDVGTTTTLPAGSPATVVNSGTNTEAVLDFGIPQGIQGDKGDTGDTGPQGEIGLDWQGAWSAGTYYRRQAVYHNDSSWVVTSVSTTEEPSLLAVDWDPLAVGGTDASGDVIGPASATDNAVARYDQTTGKLIQNSTVIISDTGDVSGVATLTYNINYTPTNTEPVGTRYYDSAVQTTTLVLPNGVRLQDGQEVHIYGKLIIGHSVANGKPLSFVSSPGQFTAFGEIDITTPAAYAFAGLITHSANDNDFVKVTKIGQVNDIDTSLLEEGKPVYLATDGTLTKVYPTGSNYVVNVGICEYVHATHGRINVQILIQPKLQDLSGVNGTPLATTGQIPVWDNTLKVFDFTSNINHKLDDRNLGTTITVLHGNPSGTLTFSPIVEEDIVLSDNTTNNVSTDKHGFMSKLPGGTTLFYRADGSFATPASVTVPYGYTAEAHSFTADTPHEIIHNFGTYPLVQAFDSSGYQVVPYAIQNTDENTIEVTFSTSDTFTIVLSVGSPQLQKYVSVADNYNALTTDRIIEVTAFGKTVTLPTATVTNVGYEYKVDNSSSGPIYVTSESGELIQGQVTQTIPSNSCMNIYANGTQWRFN